MLSLKKRLLSSPPLGLKYTKHEMLFTDLLFRVIKSINNLFYVNQLLCTGMYRVCVCVNTPCMVLISVLITGNSQVVTLFPGRLG